MPIIYFIIFLFSCTLGAVVGLGGGVIIRPILDAVGYHSIYNIAFFSSVAVLVMSLVSTSGKAKDEDGTSIDVKTAALLSMGALLGGIAGNYLFEYVIRLFQNDTVVQTIQTVLTTVVLILAIYFTISERFRYKLKNKTIYPFLGFILGASAVFLGIAGGPINVPVFIVLFGMSAKQSAAYSIVIVFFSHLFRIISMGFTMGFSSFDLSFMPIILTAAIIGGAVGAVLSKRCTNKTVTVAFNITMVGLIGLNIFNIITFGLRV